MEKKREGRMQRHFRVLQEREPERKRMMKKERGRAKRRRAPIESRACGITLILIALFFLFGLGYSAGEAIGYWIGGFFLLFGVAAVLGFVPDMRYGDSGDSGDYGDFGD
jgi:hypothetical protein